MRETLLAEVEGIVRDHDSMILIFFNDMVKANNAFEIELKEL